jgi:hypothetical protein
MYTFQPKWRGIWVHVTGICRPDVEFVEVGLPFMLMYVALHSKDHVQA